MGASHADLTDGLVSYWPLDDLQGGKAKDVVSGLNMDALNLSDADLVDGVAGKAIAFDATRQTMLERLHAEDDPLPIHKSDNLTISFWTNANAQEQFDENGNPTNDRRFFSEGATGNNNPLFNIGTANDGSNNGIDLFIRSTGTDTLNHTKSVQEPLDGNGWHHIVWTQAGADSVLYVDGVADSADFNANAFAPKERFTEDNGTLLNTTSIGGIRRGAPSHWITGAIDEVGLWSRTLSADEVVSLFNEVTPFKPTGLSEGLVSLWPLDEIKGGKAEDVISGMNLDALNLSDADVVPGKVGNAISFDATRQTMLERLHAEGDPLPIHQHDSLTISFWTKTNAQEQFDENGNPTNDRRFFSEGATGNNNPLFNIGTANDGSNNGIDLFIRSTGTDTLNHTKSVQEPLDGEDWHHIVWTQVGAESKLYVDGVLDSADFNANAFSPTERFTEANGTLLNTTSIGGIRRGAPSHWITGLIDEVAVWKRALSDEEVQELYRLPLLDGLVSHWPLDGLPGGKAEDVVGDMDLDALNLSDADVVPGQIGNALKFDATKQTMLERLHAEGDPLPIHQYEDITISFWTNTNAQEQFDENGNPTNDRRFFSEGATGNNNPLFNIGTANDGSNNGIDLFIRSTGTDTLNHTKSVQEPLDGNGWHHIVWTQAGADSKLYVDGVLDSADFNANAFSPTERFTEANGTILNTTSIGGIRRGAPSHWITGLIDDVAVWKRTLSGDEVVSLFEGAIPDPIVKPPEPPRIEVSAERLTVPKGQFAILTWEGNEDAVYTVEGIGEVATEFGVGRLEVPITEDTEFTVTATRGGESVSGSVLIHVRESVTPGWFLLDGFDDWEAGLLAANTKVGRKEYWTDPSPDPAGAIAAVDGNHVLTTNQEGPETIFTLLQSEETRDGDTRSVFFRLRLNGGAEQAAFFHVGLTNKSMRGDGFEADTAGDLGGFAVISRTEGDDFGTLSVGPGGAPLDFEIAVDTWHKVWLDITNSPGDSPDRISIHIAEENGSRVTLVEDAEGDRGNVINHDRFFVAARGENLGIEAFYIDDIFVSVDGSNDTDPLDTDDPNLVSQSRDLFGDVDSSGGPFERGLSIINIGQTQTLNISGVEITGPDAGLFTVGNVPGSLAPGQEAAIPVTFSPGVGRTGGILAFLEVSSNDQSNPVVTLDLSTIVQSSNQLIGHYQMDDADGDVMLDSALLKHGTYVAVDGGSFQLGAAGLASGTAVELGRSGQTGGGYAQARLSGGNLTSFSVSMWVQPDDGEQSSLFAKGEQGGTPTFALLYNGGTVFWFNEDNELTDPVGTIPTGEKSHVVVAYTDRNGPQPGADNLRIYINGEEVLNQDDPPAAIDNSRNPLLIGSYFGTLSFDGIIDDVQVYAKSVTSDDAAFLFANPGQPLGENELLDSDDDGLTDIEEGQLGTSPQNPDTDGDGILDGAEVSAGTNPLLTDTDNDGVSDSSEIAAGTDPTKADSDGDGFGDGAELAFGSDPNDAGSTPIGAAFTGFEHAPSGATSFAYDGVEVGWAGTTNGDVGVIKRFTNNADETFTLPTRQLMVHNGNVDLTTDSVAIDSPGDAVVSIDVRVYQNSTGLENSDFIDLCILTSADGINFDNEICFLSVEGNIDGPSEENPRAVLEDVFAVDTADAPGNGDFVTISSAAGAIPAGTTHIKLRIVALNNSDSEHFFFDNIAFKGSNGSVDAEIVDPDPGGGLPYAQNFDAFADGVTDLGDGSIIASNDGTNSVLNGVLRMTQTGVNGTAASFILPGFDASAGWSAKFDFVVEHAGENTPADGFSFNYGAIPEGENFGNPAEEGYGDITPHVSYQVDTWLWNDAAAQDAGVGIELTGTELVLTKAADDDANFQPNERVSGTAYLSWDPANGASFTTTGLRTNADFSNIATPGFAAEAGYGFSFLARTGGHNETVEIDNLVVDELGSITPPVSSDIGAGLVAYYPLDGDSNDAVGNSHGVGKQWLPGGKGDNPDGLAAHPATTLTYAPGKYGNAVDLDGVDQYIETPVENEDIFDFGAPDAPTGFTVSAWFRVDGFTKGWQALIAKGEGAEWRVHRQGENDNFGPVGGATTPNNDIGEDSTSVNDGALHHVALVSDPNGIVGYYLDGVLLDSGDTPPVLDGNIMPMMIGQNPDTDNRTWDGLIDDVALWSRALSADEVSLIANSALSVGELAGLDVPPPPTAGFDLLDVGFGANGAFQVTIPDGVTADIEYSTNLIDWELIATGLTGTVEETDAGRLAAPSGYYRAK